MFAVTAKMLDPATQNHCLDRTIQRLVHCLLPIHLWWRHVNSTFSLCVWVCRCLPASVSPVTISASSLVSAPNNTLAWTKAPRDFVGAADPLAVTGLPVFSALFGRPHHFLVLSFRTHRISFSPTFFLFLLLVGEAALATILWTHKDKLGRYTSHGDFTVPLSH